MGQAMAWLLPRSLLGRLVAVLLGGLIVAQLAAAYINLAERDRLLYRAGGMQLAQRIADIARLLDSVAPQERRRIAAVFNAPPLAVSLDRPPLAEDKLDDGQSSVFAGVLRYALGADMPLRLMRRAGGFAPPPGAPMMGPSMMGPSMMGQPMAGHAMPGLAPGSTSSLVQITLHDGTLVTFDSYLSPQEGSIPLRLGLSLLVLLGAVTVLSLIAVRWVAGRDYRRSPRRQRSSAGISIVRRWPRAARSRCGAPPAPSTSCSSACRAFSPTVRASSPRCRTT